MYTQHWNNFSATNDITLQSPDVLLNASLLCSDLFESPIQPATQRQLTIYQLAASKTFIFWTHAMPLITSGLSTSNTSAWGLERIWGLQHRPLANFQIQTISIECRPVQCSPPVCQHQTACQETWKNWVIAWKNWGIATHITSKLLRIQTTDIEDRPMRCSPSVCKNQTACQPT